MVGTQPQEEVKVLHYTPRLDADRCVEAREAPTLTMVSIEAKKKHCFLRCFNLRESSEAPADRDDDASVRRSAFPLCIGSQGYPGHVSDSDITVKLWSTSLTLPPAHELRASDDVPNADDVRAMLKDLREARQSKIAQGIDMINPYHLEVRARIISYTIGRLAD